MWIWSFQNYSSSIHKTGGIPRVFRGPALPLRKSLELRRGEFRAIVLRGHHPVLNPLLLTPILPDGRFTTNAAGPLEAFTSRIAEPFALAGVLDEQSNAILTPDVCYHLHALHSLGDCHGTYFREVFCIRMPYSKACMYSCVNANVHHTGLQIKKPSYLFPLLGGKQFTPAFPLGPFRFPLLLFCPAAFTFDSSQFIGPKVEKLL